MQTKLVAMFASFMALVFGFSASAFAALDESVGTALAAVQTDASALSAIVVPIVVAVLGMSITIKLIKRFGNKI